MLKVTGNTFTVFVLGLFTQEAIKITKKKKLQQMKHFTEFSESFTW